MQWICTPEKIIGSKWIKLPQNSKKKITIKNQIAKFFTLFSFEYVYIDQIAFPITQ